MSERAARPCSDHPHDEPRLHPRPCAGPPTSGSTTPAPCAPNQEKNSAAHVRLALITASRECCLRVLVEFTATSFQVNLSSRPPPECLPNRRVTSGVMADPNVEEGLDAFQQTQRFLREAGTSLSTLTSAVLPVLPLRPCPGPPPGLDHVS